MHIYIHFFMHACIGMHFIGKMHACIDMHSMATVIDRHKFYFTVLKKKNLHRICWAGKVRRFLQTKTKKYKSYVNAKYIYTQNIYLVIAKVQVIWRGGGLGSSTIFKKFKEPYAPS